MQETLLRAEQAQRHDLQALFQTSQLLSSSLELHSVFNNLLLTAMGKFLVSRGIALLYDATDTSWRVVVSKGILGIEEGTDIEFAPLNSGAPIAGEQLPVSLRSLGIHLLLPVRDDQSMIGAVALGRKVTGAEFNEEELQFVQSLVNMSSTSVRNSLMMEKLRRTNLDLDSTVQQLNTLFELSKEFNKTVDRTHVLKIFSFALMGHMVIRNHLFYLRRPDDSFELVSGNEGHLKSPALEFLAGIENLVRSEPGNQLDQCGITVALPILQQGVVHGILCLGKKPGGSTYSQKDVEFLYALGSLAVTAIQNVELIEERIAKQQLEEELRMARLIQRRLLPSEIPRIPEIEIATLALSSREVGGDYFDVVPLNDGRTLFMIADVTGKGVPAALLMSSIHACTHIMLPMKLTLREAIEHTNRVLYENTDSDKFITAFAAIYHPNQSLEYVNAGHEPPLLIRSDGHVDRLRDGGPLLGIIPNASYDPSYITLAPNDLIVMYTDGITEAMGNAMEEYNEERLLNLILENQNCSASRLTEMIQNDIQQFTGPVEMLSDDRTLIVLKASD
ncbi:MAG: SpoIIE family protein phosphatase [Bacteroidetes bacterium]|nr:SpoIIE family protein phosphatase [Bacteroidota bacterium]MCY4206219.1 SpoIIE family protein phosphatase [Bacteroidota bacterium]